MDTQRPSTSSDVASGEHAETLCEVSSTLHDCLRDVVTRCDWLRLQSLKTSGQLKVILEAESDDTEKVNDVARYMSGIQGSRRATTQTNDERILEWI